MTKVLQGPRSAAGLLACADAAYNRGDVAGRLKYFLRVGRLFPTHPVVKAWIGECRLALGDWSPAAWALFEYHYYGEEWADYYRHVALQVPRWTGEQSLDGKTLFVLLDGGFGDVFQNYRYTAMLERWGARVLWQVRASQAGLCPGFTEEGRIIEDVDYFVTTNGLPGAVGSQPHTVPLPYRVPGGEAQGEWPPKRVAVVTQGNPKYRSERYRSLTPFAWCDLPVTWITPPTGGDWRQTANVLRACDLCITADTAVAHLAGSLGLPTWLLLSVRSDWRWLRDRTETPWYPSMTIVRQRRLDDWHEVLTRVRSRLVEALDGVPQIA
jgi:hypothetical protein